MKNEYTTKQRTAILDFLRENAHRHVKASDVVNYMRESGTKIGTATVYRTLEKFEDEGLVRKFIVDEHTGACYQFVGTPAACHSHFHLKCTECGKLIHLSCEFLENMEKHIYNEHGFTVSSAKTVIYGVCAECSRTDVKKEHADASSCCHAK